MKIDFGTIETNLEHRYIVKKLCIHRLILAIVLVTIMLLAGQPAGASLVVSHDINTFGSAIAGSQEATFAVNVADFLTVGKTNKNILLFESNPGDGTRNYAPVVLNALTNAGFSVTVTSSYTTPFASYSALFVAQDYPTTGFLDNAALITYVDAGGGVYLAGGVGMSPTFESSGWKTFLNHYGLSFDTKYNNINSVNITSSDPIFQGITVLKSGNGQSIINLGTDPNTRIVQSVGSQGVYAVSKTVVPIPPSSLLLCSGLAILGVTYLRGHRKSS